MSALDPKGPSQPTLSQAYTTPGNPVSKDPSEQAATRQQARDSSDAVDQRIPTKQNSDAEGMPSALGRGIRGAGQGEERYGATEEDVGRHKELDGQQMAAPGEGDVASAVRRGGGDVGGEQVDLASDLDRKKAEQAEAREAIKKERASNAQIGGALGQQGGPANPVGKDNYPNTSSLGSGEA